jgi:hypothetical protein
VSAYESIFSVLMPNVRLASSLPAILWNPRAVLPGEPPLDLGLHVDVGQDAVGQDVVQAEGDEQVLQRRLDRRDGSGRARDRIVAEDDVADGERPSRQDLPADVVDVVGRRVRLDPCPEIPLRADPAARQRVEDLRADRDQLMIAHQLHDAADGGAGQAGPDRFDRGLVAVEQELLQLADRHPGRRDRRRLVRVPPQQVGERVAEQRVGVDLMDRRVAQERACALT